MDNAGKKEAVRNYKERKQLQGVFAIRCDASGEIWTGFSPNLDAHQNREWFTLRSGLHRNKAMQAAWNAHGDASFRYEIVEEVTDDNPLLIPALLKDREKHWRAKLSAAAVTG
ncbi:MAG TPA: GIY-YIG nuclease family protein [Rhizomicrobium sp.]|nr:GIY-YIG nuclease family protein [Rhizomicrobium sp.]